MRQIPIQHKGVSALCDVEEAEPTDGITPPSPQGLTVTDVVSIDDWVVFLTEYWDQIVAMVNDDISTDQELINQFIEEAGE